MSRGLTGDTYVYFDGDDVGAHIELHLLRNEVEQAARLSAAVVKAVGEIADEIRTGAAGRVIFAAGDEILAVVSASVGLEAIEEMRSAFECSTGLTISCGVGRSAAEAARSLHLAKLLGKNRIHGATVT